MILATASSPGRSEAQGIDLATDLLGSFMPLPGGTVLVRGLLLPMDTLDDPVLADILREAAMLASAPAIFEGDCRVHPDWTLGNGKQVMTFAPPPVDKASRRQVRERVEAAAARAVEVPRLWSVGDLDKRMSREAGRPERADMRRVWQRLQAHGLKSSQTGLLTRSDGEAVALRLRVSGVFSRSSCHRQFMELLSTFYEMIGIRAPVENCERIPEPAAQRHCATRATDIEFVHGEIDEADRLRGVLSDLLGGELGSVARNISGEEVQALNLASDAAGLLDGLDRTVVEAGRVLPVGMFEQK
ncbi:hypothetical protein [Palleronia abyssalis]|uniref:hypothetical protein n=1 Tax=Palleronia abyssalis TaxID=1501240 RepID=UPI0011B27145|nr:hypothetical protein [Palleronia abyssalis]